MNDLRISSEVTYLALPDRSRSVTPAESLASSASDISSLPIHTPRPSTVKVINDNDNDHHAYDEHNHFTFCYFPSFGHHLGTRVGFGFPVWDVIMMKRRKCVCVSLCSVDAFVTASASATLISLFLSLSVSCFSFVSTC